MDVVKVAKVSEISELEPLIVTVKNHVIGVLKFKGKYYAYENICAHQGGPALEGRILGRMTCDVSSSGKRLGDYHSEEKMDIICPWHGVQYDLETGICVADENFSLTSFRVVIQGGEVKVEI